MSKRTRKLRRNSTLRVEIHVTEFLIRTNALTCAQIGHLHRMLMAEASRDPIPPPTSAEVRRIFDRRSEYSRIRGGFGRASLPVAKRRAVFERDGRQCSYCGIELDWANYHCDHVEPASKGGSDEEGNLVAACRDCNLSKKDSTVVEWRARR